MHQLELFLTTFKESMKMPHTAWGKDVPQFLFNLALKLEAAGERSGCKDLAGEELRRISAMLKKLQIIEQGGTPLSVVCQYCKNMFDAKPGGEGYPEARRISHGSCPPCYVKERQQMGLDVQEGREA